MKRNKIETITIMDLLDNNEIQKMHEEFKKSEEYKYYIDFLNELSKH